MRKETKKEGRYKCCLQGQSTIIHFMHSTTWVCSTTNNSRDYLLQHFVQSEHILLRCTFIFWNISGVFKTKEKKRARINIYLRNDYDVSHYIMIMSFYFLNTHDLQTGTLRILSIIYFTQFLYIMLSASKTNPSKTFNWDLRLQKYVSIVHFDQCNQISRIPDFLHL